MFRSLSYIKIKMFVAVILIETKSLVTIPIKWVEDYKSLLVRCFNGGVKRWKREVIFFSKSIEEEPQFQLEVKSILDPTTNACYFANILRAFNTEFEAEVYADMRRPVLPVNYTERIRRNFVQQSCQPKSQLGGDGDEERFLSDVMPLPIKVKTEDVLSGKLHFVLHVSFAIFIDLL